jgi:adducin
MELTDRQQLAAALHIAVNHGWDQLIYNHFTCRATNDTFYVHPFGLLFSEVTASSLLEVDLATGELASPAPAAACSDMPYNATSYVLHSCVYRARPEVACVLHVHVPCIVAVASCKAGLVVGLSQESSLVGPVSYHDYEGIATSLDEQARIVSNLGAKSNVLFLRNHGVLCCGTSVAHALSVLYVEGCVSASL